MSGLVWLILGIVVIAVVLVVYAGTKRRAVMLAAIAGAAMIVYSFCAVVPTGFTGVVTSFGKVENNVLDAGFNVVAPWQNVIMMDNREQKISFNQSAFSSDIQEVGVTGSVIYSIGKTTAINLYRNVGVNYASIVLNPQLCEDVKSVISHYTAEGLVGGRATLSSQILDMLREDLSAYGISIVSVAIENIDFTDAFENAVEAKQVATQTKQKAQTEQEQKTMEAQQAAERQRIAAQAAADVAKIEADAQAYSIRVKAEAEAKANELIAASLTQQLINYTETTRWDGKLPTAYVGNGNGAMPILNFGQNAEATADTSADNQ